MDEEWQYGNQELFPRYLEWSFHPRSQRQDLPVRAAPNVLRYLAPIVAWAAASIALGLVVGFAAVVLPPAGAFGIVAVVAVVLLWVMPDLPLVSVGQFARRSSSC